MSRKRLINSSELMVLLGCCDNTLRKLERNGIVPIATRIGNRKKYYEEDVLTSLERHYQNRKA